MLNKTIKTRMLFALVATVFMYHSPLASAIEKSRHNEIITEKYGKSVFLMAPAYPISPNNMNFMSTVGNIPKMDSSIHVRAFTSEEHEIARQGKSVYPDIRIPRRYNDNPNLMAEEIKRIKPGRPLKPEQDSRLALKYGVYAKDYPMVMYFAPSGNLYKFPLPAFNSKTQRAAFWQTLEREVRYKRGGTSGWNRASTKAQLETENLSEEEALKKKRLFTIK